MCTGHIDPLLITLYSCVMFVWALQTLVFYLLSYCGILVCKLVPHSPSPLILNYLTN